MWFPALPHFFSRQPRKCRPPAPPTASGVTRNVLIDVESGKRGLLYERLFDLAEALGVPAAQLLAPTMAIRPHPETPTEVTSGAGRVAWR
jgi:transcriptional regulator with XRE-family HTH domain